MKSPKLERYKENQRPKIDAVQPIQDFFSTGPLAYICTKINFPSYLAPFFCSKHKTTGRNQMLHGMLLNARLDSGLQSQDLVSFLLSSDLPNQVTADYDKKSQILQVR